MLRTFSLENFKSYRQATLPLDALTVLIGANASGKSNLIEGMRLLSWLAQGQKLSAIQYAVQSGNQVIRGTIDDLIYQHQSRFGFRVRTSAEVWDSLSMSIERRTDGLHINAETLTHDGANIPLYTLDQAATRNSTDVGVAYNNFAKGPNKPRITCNDQSAIFTQLTSPASFAKEHSKSRKYIPPLAEDLERWLSAMLFLNPTPAQMRNYAFPSDALLQENGSNVSAVLFNLWGRDEQAHEPCYAANRATLLNFIQSLPEQNIVRLSFLEEPRGGVLLCLTETFGNVEHDYHAGLLSDGSLRVLALAAAMLSAAPGSLVVIEEIDNGIHPSRAQHLLQHVQSIASDRQLRVLISTHNPAMLDALPESALQDVVFCYRDPADGSSRLVRLAELPDYPELMAQGSLGDLLTSRRLENFVKFRPSADERKQRNLQWLAQMRGVS